MEKTGAQTQMHYHSPSISKRHECILSYHVPLPPPIIAPQSLPILGIYRDLFLVKNEYFLVILILTLRVADGVTSYIPASGLLPGVGEANPVTRYAIERFGFFWAFIILTGFFLGLVMAFVAATYLEEVRMASRADYRGILQVRKFRIAGLFCLTFLSSLPLLINLVVAFGLIT